MRSLKKYFLNLTLLLITVVVFTFCFLSYKNENIFTTKKNSFHFNESFIKTPLKSTIPFEKFNIWCIFTKVEKNSVLQFKFKGLITSILEHTNFSVHFHLISDDFSKKVAVRILHEINTNLGKNDFLYSFYDMGESARAIQDITDVMMPHFSSSPGTYFSDALFYLSFGLHRIAPLDQNEAIMLDCDIKFTKDVSLLYEQFNSFKPTNLFGLAPELTPLYRHILYSYRSKKTTTFGDYIHKTPISSTGNYLYGFPGYNSGVMLFNFSAIRKSTRYSNYLISKQNVVRLTDKYKFRGHLGDQDFYTLLGYEYPELFYTLSCVYNRQLCTWWRDHGYQDIFGNYSKCDGDIVVYHGNCNTPFPV